MDLPVRLLLVGDRDALSETIEAVELEFDDVTIDVVSHSGAAHWLEDHSPDGVLCAFTLPEGRDLLQTVRDDDRDLPFVFWPHDGSPAVADVAIADGATEHVPRTSADDPSTVVAERMARHIEQYRRRTEAEQLDRIGQVIRRVTSALVRADTRPDLERRVCEILTDSVPYRFAWIGASVPGETRLHSRASAGVEDGYLDEVRVSIDESATGLGPGGTAYRSGEIQVVQNVQANPEFAPWRAAATERGYQSVAAVPIIDDGTTFGVLLVYADRPFAFDRAERELLEEVAADIGFAINALETRAELEEHDHLFEHTPVGIFTTEIELDGTLIDANPSLASMLGFESPEELVSQPVTDFYSDPSDRQAFLDELTDRGLISKEVRLRRRNGDEFWALITAVTHERDSGTVVVVGAVQDITERRELADSLASEQETIQQIFETSPVAITVLDDTGTIVRANERAEEVLDLRRDELTGRRYNSPDWHIIDDSHEPIPEDQLPFARVMDTGESLYEYIHGIEDPDGDVTWLSINMVSITDEAGTIVRTVAAFEDITHRRRLERRLRESEELHRATLSNITDAVFITDDAGRFTYVCPNVRHIFGMSQDEIRQLGDIDELLGGVPIDRSTLPSDDSIENVEWELEDAEGRRHTVLINITPVDIQGGTALYSIRDITERKAMQEQLARERDRLRTVIANAPVVLFVIDAEGTYTLVEGRGLESIGMDPEDFAGQSAFELFSDHPTIPDLVRRALNGEAVETVIEFEGHHFETFYEPVEQDGVVERVIGVARDVTDRVHLEDRQRLLLEGSVDVIVILDDEGQFKYVSPSGEPVTGFDPDALAGEFAFDYVHPDDRARLVDAFTKVVEEPDRVITVEYQNLTAEGDYMDAEARVRNLIDEPAVGGIAVYLRDISERREYQRTIEQRRDQIDFFNGLLRHEVLNGMGVVTGNAALLDEELSDGADPQDRLDVIRSQGDDMVEVIQRVRTVLNQLTDRPGPLEAVDLTAAVRDRADRLERAYPEASVTTSLEAATVHADEMLGEVVYNLLSNAVQHHDGTTPRLEVEVATSADGPVLTIADDGPGIPEDRVTAVLEGELVEPLTSEGGFGLYFVQTMCTKYGATLDIGANDPRGTVVRMGFPAEPPSEGPSTTTMTSRATGAQSTQGYD